MLAPGLTPSPGSSPAAPYTGSSAARSPPVLPPPAQTTPLLSHQLGVSRLGQQVLLRARVPGVSCVRARQAPLEGRCAPGSHWPWGHLGAGQHRGATRRGWDTAASGDSLGAPVSLVTPPMALPSAHPPVPAAAPGWLVLRAPPSRALPRLTAASRSLWLYCSTSTMAPGPRTHSGGPSTWGATKGLEAPGQQGSDQSGLAAPKPTDL